MKSLSELLDYSVEIMSKELDHLNQEVKTGPLSFQSAQTLNNCIRTLVMASKGKEQLKGQEDDQLDGLTDEELLEMAKKLVEEVPDED
jgi:hypothetical protein